MTLHLERLNGIVFISCNVIRITLPSVNPCGKE